MMYYSFNEPALNGFSPILEHKYQHHPHYHLIAKIPLEVKTLAEILHTHCARDKRIDFMSIDVEGLDLEVLKSNDWQHFAPRIILIESWDSDLENLHTNAIFIFLKMQGYKLYAKTTNTLFFQKDSIKV